MRSPGLLLPTLLVLAVSACGDEDSSDSGAAESAGDSSSTELSATSPDGADAADGGDADNGTDADGSAEPAPTGSLETLLTLAPSGALGESVELSPSGDRLAHFTGGINAEIVVYDLATGSETGRVAAPDFVAFSWITDDRMVAWNPSPLTETGATVRIMDVATLTAGEPVVPTYEGGFASCQLPFSFDFPVDRTDGALFASAPADEGGTLVCRLDVATTTVTSTVVDTTGALPELLIDAAGTTLTVVDGAALSTQAATAYQLDAASLAPTATVELPTGAAKATVGDDLVVPGDGGDRLLASGAGFGAMVQLGAGPYAIGSPDGSEMVLYADTGAAIGPVGPGFPREIEVDESGTVVAATSNDAITVVRVG